MSPIWPAHSFPHKTNSHKRLTVSVFKRQKQPERVLLSTAHFFFFPRARGALLISLSERSVAVFSISTLIDSLNAARLSAGGAREGETRRGVCLPLVTVKGPKMVTHLFLIVLAVCKCMFPELEAWICTPLAYQNQHRTICKWKENCLFCSNGPGELVF